jgi:hypothetical protein
MLTRMHFVQTAEILREAYNSAQTNETRRVVEETADSFAKWFKSDNPNFNRARFDTYIFESDNNQFDMVN